MKALLLIPLLFAANLYATEVTLTWRDNSDNEEGFKIERKETGSEFVPIGTVLANVSEFTDETQAGTYEYRVRAFNDFGYSGYTNTLKLGPPNAPDNLEREVSVEVTVKVIVK